MMLRAIVDTHEAGLAMWRRFLADWYGNRGAAPQARCPSAEGLMQCFPRKFPWMSFEYDDQTEVRHLKNSRGFGKN